MKLTDPALFRQQALIGGEWHDAADGKRFAIHSPANAETVGHAPRCTTTDVERAIETAHVEAAFGGVKQSGLRREGGRSGIDEYPESKYVKSRRAGMNVRASSLVYGSSRSFRGGFMKPVFALVLLCAAGLDAALASVPAPRHLINPDTRRIEDPDALVERYLEAVDRGKLRVFGQTIDRAMIVPVRVEYVYELSDRAMRIKVYSNLVQPLAVPGQNDCQIRGVSAVMEEGVITEIESHVWLK